MSERDQPEESGSIWQSEPPTLEDFDRLVLNGRGSAHWWVRGGLYNRPILVEVNVGARRDDVSKVFKRDLNFRFLTLSNMDNHILWRSELEVIFRAPRMEPLEWAGPIFPPGSDQPEVSDDAAEENPDSRERKGFYSYGLGAKRPDQASD